MKHKKPHVWVVERMRDGAWVPVGGSCGNTKRSAQRITRYWRGLVDGHKYRVSKYTRTSK